MANKQKAAELNTELLTEKSKLADLFVRLDQARALVSRTQEELQAQFNVVSELESKEVASD